MSGRAETGASAMRRANDERSPEFADFMRVARELGPLVAADADEAERLRHMTDKVVAAFKEADLYRIMAPKALGGAQLSWVEAMRVVEQISLADGAAGWCLMVGALILGHSGAYLPADGAEVMFARGKDLLMAGQGPPQGTARAVPGGYQVSGRWSYASGIHHADFIRSGCLLMDGGKPVMSPLGIPEVLLCHVERKHVEVEDNWHVIGLGGTGSFDYSIHDVFVPQELTFLGETREPVRGSHLYTIGLTGFTAWGHTGFALGVGRHALDEIAHLAQTKRNVFGLLGEGAGFQQRYARAEAMYRSVREFCYAVWADVDETLARQESASLEQIALLRLGMTYVHEVVSEVCAFAHKAGGGASLRQGILQRCFRDIHAATQHVHLSDQITQDTGKVLLGMAGKNATWTIIGLR
jgi:alkylation response protein AidB-like acyl-CoA dehydrogenase